MVIKSTIIKSIILIIYFQLVSANLSRRDDENNASCGYRESDLKLEINRASRLVSIANKSSFKFIRHGCFYKYSLMFLCRRVITVKQEVRVLAVA